MRKTVEFSEKFPQTIFNQKQETNEEPKKRIYFGFAGISCVRSLSAQFGMTIIYMLQIYYIISILELKLGDKA